MFSDIGALEVVALVILAVLVFGPDKLPKVIKDVMQFVRKVREFSDSAKADIRSELGPEFKDFEFEDLHPKNFVRKQLMDNDELGLKEIRNGFDFKEEMSAVTDAVHGRDSGAGSGSSGSSGTPDRLRKRDGLTPGEAPPFDSDAT
ncbi:sec-independent translocase [Actinacidiphila glaucinigra]|uniref:sec-independent translocase n=1 Tax=Actinacidiphila glaucinigra TaxID=235986 RepID=UPI002DD8F9D8|nr:sec-independent translocase [Actinacidiphila glaucinigra]WSD60300.1 sec-independent translocase [Actinacidiphila glaucinigra]